jgi:hypothetical protein
MGEGSVDDGPIMKQTIRTQSSGRWAPGYLLPPILALAGYGLLRAALLAWSIHAHGLPRSLPDGAGLGSDVAAAVQGFAAALILARPALRRPWLAWSVVALTLTATAIGAAGWVGLGSGGVSPQVRQIMLAVVLSVIIMLVGGWRPRWARNATEIDLVRVRSVLLIITGAAGVVAAISALVVALAHPAGAVHRLAVLVLGTGAATVLVALLAVAFVLGEERRLVRQEVHRRLTEHRGPARDQDTKTANNRNPSSRSFLWPSRTVSADKLGGVDTGHPGRRRAAHRVQTGVTDVRNTKKVRQLAAALRDECAVREVVLVAGQAEELLADPVQVIAHQLGITDQI